MRDAMVNQAVVSSNLIRAREACGLSRDELARRCNISSSVLSNIESRRKAISPEIIIQIAEALNCNPCDLLLYISDDHH